MKNSISNRIRITKKGKIKRRAMALGHSRANKRKIQMLRKRSLRDLAISLKTVQRLGNIPK